MAVVELESLGLDAETIEDRLIAALCDRLLATIGIDDGGDEYARPSPLRQRLDKAIAVRVDDAIRKLAETHVLPRAYVSIETLTLQETNRWGEKAGKALTLTEYLVARAEAYMQEKVDSNGKGKDESSSYSWKGTQTRLSHAIHHYLHVEVERAMKQVLGDANTQITKAIESTCRQKLKEIGETLKVKVETK